MLGNAESNRKSNRSVGSQPMTEEAVSCDVKECRANARALGKEETKSRQFCKESGGG